MTSIHVTGRTGHTAHADFDTEERAKTFLAAIRAGDDREAAPLQCGTVTLGDDFRPFVGKKLRYQRRVADTTYYEEA